MNLSTDVGTFKDTEPPKIPGEEGIFDLNIQSPTKMIIEEEENNEDIISMSVASAAVS